MSNTHCPGFESNKSLSEIKVKCPECKFEWEIFSDEKDKAVKCPECGVAVAPAENLAS
jgi:ribosomal protein S27E